ncbi:MAG: hypothetical protein HQK57_11355 [Deltaproteobacteria bacterium]|nr:hypothetical protein [Deltaproteobacteria bacterium]MBF0526649.1 hypothetical protein [Deltaproteobacteria bacterium]
MRWRILVVLGLAGMMVCPPAYGGYLRMTTQTDVKVENNNLNLQVKVTNDGDEPALNVRILARLQDKELKSEVKEKMGVKESFSASLTQALPPDLKPGRYPLPVTVEFHDLNNYPFSALSVSTFYIRENPNAGLAFPPLSVELEKERTVHFAVKNTEPEAKKVKVTFVVPRELTVPVPVLEDELGPRSEKDIFFDLKNFSALPSTYPFFAVMEYDQKGLHYTAVANFMVTVKKERSLFQAYWPVLAVLAGALLVIFVLLQFRRKPR